MSDMKEQLEEAVPSGYTVGYSTATGPTPTCCSTYGNLGKRQMRWEMSEQVGELFAARAKAQPKMEAAKKASTNPQYSSKYADLGAVLDACLDALAEQGICITQLPVEQDGKYGCHTLMGHASGQWISCTLVFSLAESRTPEVHRAGSAISYARRYSAAAIAGVATEDDDGNAAGEYGRGAQRTEKSPPRPAPKKAEEPVPETAKDVVAKTGRYKDKALPDWPTSHAVTVLEKLEKMAVGPAGVSAAQDASRVLIRQELKKRIEFAEGDLLGAMRADMVNAAAISECPQFKDFIGDICKETDNA